MVSQEEIEAVLNNAMNKFTVKCGPTIAEMHEKLNGRKYEDIYLELVENNLLNPLEQKDWYRLWGDGVGSVFGDISGFEGEGALDGLFYYAKRLFNGVEYNEVPTINKDNYNEDAQFDKQQFKKERQGLIESDEEYSLRRNDLLNDLSNSSIEKNQIQSQQNMVGRCTFKGSETKYLGEMIEK